MIKDIAVHLTGSDEDRVRLRLAETIADQFGAHLTGLLVHLEPELLGAPDLAYAEFLQQMLDDAKTETNKRRAKLEQDFERMTVPNDLRVVSGLRSQVGQALAAETHTADLFVGTRPYGDPDRQHRTEETVLFSSGRPCLLLPPKSSASGRFENVLVAWKSGREAARAVKDALPFLQQAEQVTIALATEEADEETRTSSGADVARYLSRHGVHAEVRELAGWNSAADALANEVEASRAQLVVAGAYGHTRMVERLLGGVTRTLLTECAVPVLLAR